VAETREEEMAQLDPKNEVERRVAYMPIRNNQASGPGAGRWREWLAHPGSAVVVARKEGRVCLIRQWRAAISQQILELPAGLIDRGEEPLAAAKRELREETGLSGGRWHSLLSSYTTPGYSDELQHFFLSDEPALGSQDLDSGEELEVEWFTVEEINELLRDGAICDGKTIQGLAMIGCLDFGPGARGGDSRSD